MLKENLEFESLTYETLGNTKERKEHFFKFVESGFPSKKLEDWKFSDLKSIINWPSDAPPALQSFLCSHKKKCCVDEGLLAQFP